MIARLERFGNKSYPQVNCAALPVRYEDTDASGCVYSRYFAYDKSSAFCKGRAMNRLLVSLLRGGLILLGLCLWLPLRAQVSVYHDRTTFLNALKGLSAKTEDYESSPPGDLPVGSTLGDFTYTFDPTVTQPAIVAGGNGGQALGGSPFDVFVGGDSVTLTAGTGSTLQAFGADFLYAPAFSALPNDTYRLGLADGTSAGQFAGSLDTLDPNGGTFFLGLIAAPSAAFSRVTLFSVQTDPTFLVPAYQVDNLIYAGTIASSVPEPGSLALLLAGSAGSLMLCARRRQR